MSEYGEKLNIPIDGDGEVVCPKLVIIFLRAVI